MMCRICGTEHNESRHTLLMWAMLGTWYAERQQAQPAQVERPRKWSEAQQRIARMQHKREVERRP